MKKPWTIVKSDRGWQLMRDGKPFYIQGAVAGGHFDELAKAGANALRTSARKDSLDHVHKLCLVALVDLPVRGERDGMNWGDEKQVAEQMHKVLERVQQFKDHPAVMMWAVGNELDWIPPNHPHHPKLWEHLNELAREIHRIDSLHPVCTVVGTGDFEEKVQEMAKACPDFDFLGINTYGDIANAAEAARKHWPKPYVIAEWGPTGHWQVPKTPWHAPIEQTSSEKAQSTFDRYRNVILADGAHCLGSFVFYWAEKQETTHTWYGLFRDGLKTESIDVMTFFWTGAWPANRAPAIAGVVIETRGHRDGVHLSPSSEHEAQVFAFDPDHDPLTVTWDIRPEVVILPENYAGNMEKPAQPIDGLIRESKGPRVRFVAPKDEGAYRLFVQVTDGQGHAGYANVPFLVSY